MTQEPLPPSEARVGEILQEFRTAIPLEIPSFARPVEPAPAPRRPLFREPHRDPKRHPFEACLGSYTSLAQTTASVFFAWGTVLPSEDDIENTAEIVGRDESHEMSSGDWAWLECEFTIDGDLTSCHLLVGNHWPGFPACYTDNGEDGNLWFHPIAQVRACRTAKSAGKPDAPFPDSGEFPELAGSLKIAQLTHTHLVKRRICVGDALQPIWALVPGQGGAGD